MGRRKGVTGRREGGTERDLSTAQNYYTSKQTCPQASTLPGQDILVFTKASKIDTLLKNFPQMYIKNLRSTIFTKISVATLHSVSMSAVHCPTFKQTHAP